MHQDGFGPYVSPENTKLASRYFEASNEDDAIKILEEMGTRYVLADQTGAGQPPYDAQSMTRRLVDLAGSGGDVGVGKPKRRKRLPALSRHRLVYAAPNGARGAWLYEIVPGALIEGTTTPGARVTLEVQLRAPSGHPRTWTNRQRADEKGEFRLRAPYATVDAQESGFTPVGRYQIRTRHGVAEFDIAEASIQQGATVQAPTIE